MVNRWQGNTILSVHTYVADTWHFQDAFQGQYKSLRSWSTLNLCWCSVIASWPLIFIQTRALVCWLRKTSRKSWLRHFGGVQTVSPGLHGKLGWAVVALVLTSRGCGVSPCGRIRALLKSNGKLGTTRFCWSNNHSSWWLMELQIVFHCTNLSQRDPFSPGLANRRDYFTNPLVCWICNLTYTQKFANV